MSAAQTPAEAAGPVLDLALSPAVDPNWYGELVRFGRVLSWEPAEVTRDARGRPSSDGSDVAVATS
jgi:carbonyl reductase 1